MFVNAERKKETESVDLNFGFNFKLGNSHKIKSQTHGQIFQ